MVAFKTFDVMLTNYHVMPGKYDEIINLRQTWSNVKAKRQVYDL